TGHLEDDDLQLTYMQQRYYDPLIGRFYSNDPVGFTASNPMMFNRYAYANNNPYKYVDPDGKKAESFFVQGKTYENMGQAVSGAWGDLRQSLNSDVQERSSKVADAVSEATPSRETAHTVGNGASLLLAVGAVTTPCSAACATGSLVIDAAIAADHLSQGDVKSAALTILPGAVGEGVSVAHKATKVGANVAEAGKRGAATNVITNQVVGDTQEHQKIEKDN
ncbi:RHS repeat-associated core domain-containing protein, partial [Rheinheimera nanhaiensis]|uniref:RHS repeat-associated core domain-containing protein n=1 Tax=Rheinheimera nanhaiensis TaxID=1163621 RepID=UPI0005904056